MYNMYILAKLILKKIVQFFFIVEDTYYEINSLNWNSYLY
jgi:hypothetical protein